MLLTNYLRSRKADGHKLTVAVIVTLLFAMGFIGYLFPEVASYWDRR